MLKTPNQVALSEVAVSTPPSARVFVPLKLPPDRAVLESLRQMAGDRSLRIDSLAQLLLKDPVIFLEFLKTANSVFLSQGKSPVLLPRQILIRLGSSQIIELLDQLATIPSLGSENVAQRFEELREKSIKVAYSSSIISSVIRRDLSDEAYFLGLIAEMGHLLACAQFQELYLELSRDRAKAALCYKLQNDHHFDVRKMLLDFLRTSGFPQSLFFALDRELSVKSPEKLPLRYIVESAIELADAYEAKKWERYIPTKELPLSSSLRLLQMTPRQYREIYDRLSYFLEHGQEKIEEDEEPEESGDEEEDYEEEVPGDDEETFDEDDSEEITDFTLDTDSEDSSLDQEIDFLLDSLPPQAVGLSSVSSSLNEISLNEMPREEPLFTYAENSLADIDQDINLLIHDPDPSESLPPPVPGLPRIDRPFDKIAEHICSAVAEIKALDGLIQHALEQLTSGGYFKRACILSLAPNKKSAHIEKAIGDGFEVGTEIAVSSSDSPLLKEGATIKSFSAPDVNSPQNPFSVRAFALAPLKIPNTATLIVYADCGSDGLMTFESRRIFRCTMDIINQSIRS